MISLCVGVADIILYTLNIEQNTKLVENQIDRLYPETLEVMFFFSNS